MSSAARATPLSSLNAVIYTCIAELEVTSPTGPISSPETLLAALRTEILPALSTVLEAPEWQGIALRVDHIEIDLGTWPDDPAWSDVRYVLATKLRDALAQHLPVRPQDTRGTIRLPLVSGSDDSTDDASSHAATPGPVGGNQVSAAKDLNDPRSGVLPAGHFSADGANVSAGLAPDRSVINPLTTPPRADLPSVPDAPALADAQATQNLRQHEKTAERFSKAASGAVSNTAKRDLSTAIAAFQRWVEALTSPVSVADILAHVAAQPDQVDALVAWQNMPQAAREQAWRLSPDVQQSVSTAAARLASSTRIKSMPPGASQDDRARRFDAALSEEVQGPPDRTETSKAEAEPDRSHAIETEYKSAKAGHDPDALPPGRNSRRTGGFSGGNAAADRTDAPSLGPAAPFDVSTGHALTTAVERSTTIATQGGKASDPVALPLSSGEALDHIRAALASDDPGDRHWKAAAQRLRTSFEWTGLRRDAAETAVVSALARLRTVSLRDDAMARSDRGVPKGFAEIASTTDVPDEGRRGIVARLDASSVTDAQIPSASVSGASELENKGHVPEIMQTHDQKEPAYDTQVAAAASFTQADVAELAVALGLDTGGSLYRQLTDALSRTPHAVFDAAAEASALGSLASILANAQDSSPPLMIHLSPAQLRRLTVENAVAMAQAVRVLSELQALALVQHLLPPQATLLRGEIETLRDRAKSPVRALQQAAIALLQNTALDMEDLMALPALQQPLKLLPQDGFSLDIGDTTPSDPSTEADTGNDIKTPPEPLLAQPKVPRTQVPELSDAVFGNEFLDATPSDPSIEPQTGPDRATPLETILALSGLSASEVDRVMGRGPLGDAAQAPVAGQRPRVAPPAARSGTQVSTPEATRSDAADRRADQRSISQPSAAELVRDDAALLSHVSRLSLGDAWPEKIDGIMGLIWRFWPVSTTRSGSDAVSAFALLRARIATLITPAETLLDHLGTATQAIEPDKGKRVYALRTVAARLAVEKGSDLTGQRQTARAVVDALLAPEKPVRDTKPTAMRALYGQSPQFADRAGSDTREETLLVTETAGLVLLHPFYVLLFDRLQIAREGKALLRDDLPRALGALHFLAGEDHVDDPLQRLLLGLDVSLPLPEAQTPDAEGADLMTGLLRSVVDRWGRLGSTSPDGLREAFIQRTGSLRFDAVGAHLRVTSGPFDMLLDGLPWSIGQVTLPWMPLPCHVSWREENDA